MPIIERLSVIEIERLLDYYRETDRGCDRETITNILKNSRSCIDLLFTSQPNMVMTSVVHASRHPHCHRKKNFAKFDLKCLIHLLMRGIFPKQTLIIKKSS